MASNEIADVLLQVDPKDVGPHCQVTRKYVRRWASVPRRAEEATTTARQKLVELAVAMEIRVTPAQPLPNCCSCPMPWPHKPAAKP